MGRRKDLDSDTVTKKIKAAATQLFAAKGVVNVTMEDIAAEVNYSMPTLSTRFGIKWNLFLILALPFWRSFNSEVLARIEKEDNPSSKMFALLTAMQSFWNKEKDFSLAVLGLDVMSFRLPKKTDSGIRENWALVKKEIEKFQRLGISIIEEGRDKEFKIEVSSEILWLLFWGGFRDFMRNHFKERILRHRKSYSQEDIDKVNNLLIQILERLI